MLESGVRVKLFAVGCLSMSVDLTRNHRINPHNGGEKRGRCLFDLSLGDVVSLFIKHFLFKIVL